jgi:protocatechuate 3,4-dioxygenase beta subunit
MSRLPCVFLFAVLCAPAQSIEGTVLDTSTGKGIPGAKVEIVPTTRPARSGAQREEEADALIFAMEAKAAYSAIADADGVFRIGDVEPGTYTARYSAAGCIEEEFSAGSDRPAVHPFDVAAGNPVKLQGRMLHMAFVSGRVIDGRGQPVPRARVDIQTGRLRGAQNADASGRFESVLYPNSPYTLSATPPPGLKPPDPEPGTGRALAWARTYYPGVTLPAAASKFTLAPGARVESVEIKLAAAPAYAIRGVLHYTDGTPASKIAITLGTDAATPVFHAESRAGGAFEFTGVADGGWLLLADADRGAEKLKAIEWIEVNGRDIDTGKVPLNPRFAVRGKVVRETPGGATAGRFEPVRFVPVTPLHVPFQGPTLAAFVDDNGSFLLDHVYAGIYRLATRAPAAPYYIAGMRLGAADLPTLDVELTSGTLPITITLKSDGGTLRGAVEECGRGAIFLLPEEPGMRTPEFVRTARCDEANHYEISAVRPGSYLAVAFPADPLIAVRETDFDDAYLNHHATAVNIKPAQTTTADLRLTTRP